jgi:FecR protein.
MTRFSRISFVLAAALASSAGLQAQSVISARSGIVHYVEGDVFLGDKAVTPTFGQFPDIKEGDRLSTTEGRAEVLLTPGVFLRLAENSAVRMISNRLIDTRVEILKGSVLVECAEVMKDNANTFVMGDATFEVRKKGLVRLDADSMQAKVYAGEVLVSRGSDTLTLKEGRQTAVAACSHRRSSTTRPAMRSIAGPRAGQGTCRWRICRRRNRCSIPAPNCSPADGASIRSLAFTRSSRWDRTMPARSDTGSMACGTSGATTTISCPCTGGRWIPGAPRIRAWTPRRAITPIWDTPPHHGIRRSTRLPRRRRPEATRV